MGRKSSKYSERLIAIHEQWARDNGVPVGPGRGSGAGSLVAFALGITRLDPIVHGLLFERFLNPERVSLPDFDIDFCMVGRDRVIEYVSDRYGSEKVAQIITFFDTLVPPPHCGQLEATLQQSTQLVMGRASKFRARAEPEPEA